MTHKFGKIAIIDCGTSNLTSVCNAFSYIGAETQIIRSSQCDPSDFTHAVLPGVGTYSRAMKNLHEMLLFEFIEKYLVLKRPLLGICLGMQVLSACGDEVEKTEGLNIIGGSVSRVQLNDPSLRLPHVGWNDVCLLKPSPLFKDIPDKTPFYFIHSYAFSSDVSPEYVIGKVEYGGDVIVAVEKDHVFGVQFHPEKSQRYGLALLKNFLEIC
ncbi:MAG: imidazole glycerol phosphate synthase subunit HisH [Deltaproteobacteria bacterium]|nr:imidazole glycerol phosphate synthase subunit HisH [Deltaproteobacteria bacterium]